MDSRGRSIYMSRDIAPVHVDGIGSTQPFVSTSIIKGFLHDFDTTLLERIISSAAMLDVYELPSTTESFLLRHSEEQREQSTN